MYATEYQWPQAAFDLFPGLTREHTLIKLGKRAARADRKWPMIEHALAFVMDYDVESMLDIGSGLALLVPLIVNYARLKKVHLMDADCDSSQPGTYDTHMQPWASVWPGVAIVKANVHPDVEVQGHTTLVSVPGSIDLVTSFRSWGHHYPVETYAVHVRELLSPRGFVLMDFRIGLNGLDQMKASGFEEIWELPEASTKCTRHLLQRKD